MDSFCAEQDKSAVSIREVKTIREYLFIRIRQFYNKTVHDGKD